MFLIFDDWQVKRFYRPWWVTYAITDDVNKMVVHFEIWKLKNSQTKKDKNKHPPLK